MVTGCGDWRGGARSRTQVGLDGVSRLLPGGHEDPVSHEHYDLHHFLFFFHPVFDKQKFPKITAANQLEKQRGDGGGGRGVCPFSTELVWSGTPQRAAPSSLPLMKSPEAVIVKLPW